MKTDRSKVYEVIDAEREYQDSRWHASSTDSEGLHSNLEFLVYIRDYVEEAMHFCSRNEDPVANDFAKKSLRKIAALAVAAMEQNGVVARSPYDMAELGKST